MGVRRVVLVGVITLAALWSVIGADVTGRHVLVREPIRSGIGSGVTRLHTPAPTNVLFSYRFPSSTQLITNEYAYLNPGRADAITSSSWVATSGSLFSRDGLGWTGPVDREPSGPSSHPHTDSAVFRVVTRRGDFGDVLVQFRLAVAGLTSTRATPAQAWDGVHIWLRHQSEYSLYAVSVVRRDGAVVIKKKCPEGPSNGGAYYELTPEIPDHAVRLNDIRYVGATAMNNPDGSVRVTLVIDGRFVAGATDRGAGCPPIRSPGAVGIRGDNTEFSFGDFSVAGLDGGS